MMTRTQKILLIVSGVLLLGVLVFGGIQSFMHRGKVRVQVSVLPEDSTLTLDGQPAKAGKMYLTKGEHTLKASRSGFKDDEKKIHTDNINSKQTIYLLPTPNSKEAEEWLNQHPEVDAKREAAGAQEAQDVSDDLGVRYPFLDKLPYETTDYRIDYALGEDNKELTLHITLMPVANQETSPNDYRYELQQYKDAAMDWMRQNGVNPDKRQLVFTPNPF